MKYIGNVLTTEPFDSKELYHIVDSPEKLIDGIPTLIIGWDNAKSLYPDASIIEWEISDNVFWTYGKYEKRDKYEANIKRFQTYAFKNFVESLIYVFYDVLSEPLERFESFLSFISSDSKKIAYITGDMLYLYPCSGKKVIGLSLRDCDYLDVNLKKRLFSAIYNNKNISLLKSGESIPKEIRFQLKGMSYILPYIYS